MPRYIDFTNGRTSKLRRFVPALATGIALSAAAPAAGAVPENRIVDPGAEDSTLAAWQVSGAQSVAFGTSNTPATPGIHGDGARLFAFGSSPATLTQLVSVADLAAAIDGPGVRLSFGGSVGANGPRADAVQIAVQPLDSNGAPLGPAQSTGPQTPAQRQNRTTLLPCTGSIQPPAGTRAIQLGVSSTGASDGTNTAFADDLYVTTATIALPTSGVSGDNGCFTDTTVASPTPQTPPAPKPHRPTPKLTSLVSMSSRAKCRTTAARLRVKAGQRSNVKRLLVAYRGRTSSVDPRRTVRYISVPMKGRRTTVKVKVSLADGRTRTGTVTYRSCN